MAVVHVCGFECRQAAAGAALVPAERHWTGFGGTATIAINTTTFRSGTASLRVTATSQTGYASKTLSPEQAILAGRVYVRVATMPSVAVGLVSFEGNITGSRISLAASGQLSLTVNTTTVDLGSPISTGQWYRLDFLNDLSTATHSLKARLDGGTEAEATSAAGADDSMFTFSMGTIFTAATDDLYFDDLIIGNAAADYPFGAGTVERLKPNQDGVHSFTAGDFGFGTAGADVAVSATNVYTYVDADDITVINTAELIRQKVIRSTGYVHVDFPAGPLSVDAQAVNVISTWHAAGTQACTIGMKLTSDGWSTSKTITDEAGDGLIDPSNATIGIAQKLLVGPAEGGAWTAAKIGGIRIRVGYSTDITPNPYWDGVVLEVAYPDAAGAGPVALAGSSAGATTVPAAMLHRAVKVGGASAGVATAVLKLRGAVPLRSAIVAGAATASAGPLQITKRLAGLTAGTTTAVAGPLRIGKRLIGVAAGAATAGPMILRKSFRLAGLAGGAAGAVARLAIGLRATTAGAATAVGRLRGVMALRAVSAGAATSAALMTNTKRLIGASAGQATAASALTTVQGGEAVTLTGASVGTASAVGSLRRAVRIPGVVAGVSSAAARLSGVVPVKGAAVGAATAVAFPRVKAALRAVAAGMATGTARLRGSVPVRGLITGAASAIAFPRIKVAIRAASPGAATAGASLFAAGQVSLAGSAAGLTTVTNAFGVQRGLRAVSSGQAVVVADLSGKVPLSATVAGAGAAGGSLVLGKRLAGASVALSAASALMRRQMGIRGSAAGTSSAILGLRLAAGLRAAAAGQTTGLGRLAVIGEYIPVYPLKASVSQDRRLIYGERLAGRKGHYREATIAVSKPGAVVDPAKRTAQVSAPKPSGEVTSGRH